MEVKLISCTPDMERIIAVSAGLCYSNHENDILNQRMSDGDVYKLLNKIIDSGHESALEHGSFTFAISGVSRNLTHQLVRHRLASFNQQSQRYVSMNLQEYIIPPRIKNNETTLAFQYHEDKTISEKYYNTMEMCFALYEEMISFGISKEDARYILPSSVCTNINMTMNCRELLHFLELRCCERAQWEIRELANKILEICKEKSPIIFNKAGASCVRCGECREGTMSCGKININ